MFLYKVNNIKYHCENIVYVANNLSDDWIAMILEIKGSGSGCTYARVCWMYWLNDLPPNTKHGKKLALKRQPSGREELFASNHSRLDDFA
jgi:hypothetical protein